MFEQKPSSQKMYLSGYGVELAIKSTEYKALDDTQVKSKFILCICVEKIWRVTYFHLILHMLIWGWRQFNFKLKCISCYYALRNFKNLEVAYYFGYIQWLPSHFQQHIKIDTTYRICRSNRWGCLWLRGGSPSSDWPVMYLIIPWGQRLWI